jgi:hypothetical protein
MQVEVVDVVVGVGSGETFHGKQGYRKADAKSCRSRRSFATGSIDFL